MERLKTDVWKKSYLLEFYDGANIGDVFTFSVPPESEQFVTTQRKTETKTFGGLHVDEYGSDATQISLSGNTINNELKLIYRPGKGDKWMSGEEEIFYIENLIKKYKTDPNLIDQKIVLYDLSKTSMLSSKTVRYWRVYLGSFSIKRSKEKPFTYNYSIEFTGVPLEEQVNYPVWGKLDFNKLVKSSQAICDKISKAMSWTQKVKDYAQQAKDAFQAVEDVTKQWETVITDSVRDVTGIVSSYYEVLEKGLATANSVWESVGNLCNLATTELATDPVDIIDRFGNTWQSEKDKFQETFDTLYNNGANIVALYKSAPDRWGELFTL